jgi:hypothetical protein
VVGPLPKLSQAAIDDISTQMWGPATRGPSSEEPPSPAAADDAVAQDDGVLLVQQREQEQQRLRAAASSSSAWVQPRGWQAVWRRARERIA